MIRFTILMLSCLTLFGTPRRPAWVDTPPHAPHLYQGFGVADKSGSAEEDRQRADQNARAELIQQISSTISSEVSSYYQETAGASEEDLDVFTSLSSSYAVATLEGMQIVDRYYDRKHKLYYSYATLSRTEFQSQMTRRAGTAKLYAGERFNYAQQAIKNGNISSALNHLSEALGHVLVAQSIVKRHLDGDLDNDGITEFLDAGLSHEIATLIHKTRFIKFAGDGQKGERDQALPHPFTGRVYFEYNGMEIPAANTPLSVSLEGATGDFSSIINTDADGKYQVRINRIISASTPDPQVKIHFYLPHLSLLSGANAKDLAILISGSANYNFSIDVLASIKIFVRVLEEINGERVTRPKSEALLIKALISQKYKVMDAMRISRSISIDDLDFSLYYEEYDTMVESLSLHANYAIVGLISSETSSTGTLNYAHASAKINVIDLSTGRILSSGSQSNIKAAGNTEHKANTSALKKCAYAAITDIMRGLKTSLK
ncbi:MAG: LPP20 family lipoprotein [Candidatus Marinimicrobia bacterium]|nr:LPP20 family lipoprotein [Candidatus Neomarinimicrobiota bacterium]